MAKAAAEAAKRTRGMSAEEVYKTLKSQIIRLELAPGTVLKGLMRRIDKTCEVIPHDAPTSQPTTAI